MFCTVTQLQNSGALLTQSVRSINGYIVIYNTWKYIIQAKNMDSKNQYVYCTHFINLQMISIDWMLYQAVTIINNIYCLFKLDYGKLLVGKWIYLKNVPVVITCSID